MHWIDNSQGNVEGRVESTPKCSPLPTYSVINNLLTPAQQCVQWHAGARTHTLAGKHIQPCQIFITIIKLTDFPTSHSPSRCGVSARACTHAHTHTHTLRHASYWEVKWGLWEDVSAEIRKPSNVSASSPVTCWKVGVWAVGNGTSRRKQEERAACLLGDSGTWHIGNLHPT